MSILSDRRALPLALVTLALCTFLVPSAAAISLDGPAQAEPIDVAQLRCSRSHTWLDTPEVNVQADGPHINVVNLTGAKMWVDVEGEGFGIFLRPNQAREFIWNSVAPGPYQLTCEPQRPGATPPETVELTVMDFGATFHSDAFECDGSSWAMAVAFVEGARGTKGDPVVLVRKWYPRIRVSDVLDYAWYPESTQPAGVRLTREGNLIGVFELFRGTRGWLLSSINACSTLHL